MAVQGVQQVDGAIVKAYAQDLLRLLEESGLTERKGFIRSFVKRIDVDKEQATIHYRLPLPPDKRMTDQFEVLPIVTFGGAGGIRTPDLLTASQALSQLSHSPTFLAGLIYQTPRGTASHLRGRE